MGKRTGFSEINFLEVELYVKENIGKYKREELEEKLYERGASEAQVIKAFKRLGRRYVYKGVLWFILPLLTIIFMRNLELFHPSVYEWMIFLFVVALGIALAGIYIGSKVLSKVKREGFVWTVFFLFVVILFVVSLKALSDYEMKYSNFYEFPGYVDTPDSVAYKDKVFLSLSSYTVGREITPQGCYIKGDGFKCIGKRTFGFGGKVSSVEILVLECNKNFYYNDLLEGRIGFEGKKGYVRDYIGNDDISQARIYMDDE